MIYPSEYINPSDDPNFGTKSAEETFYNRLKEELAGTGNIVFYNLILNLAGVEHREIDFLVINPSGVFILELKNGRWKVEANTWKQYITERKKWEPAKRNPIEQLETASEEFFKFLKINNNNRPPVKPDSIYRLLLLLKNSKGSIQFKTDSNIIFQERAGEDLGKLMKLKTSSLTPNAIKKIETIVLQNTNYYPTFERRMEDHEKRIIALTKEQYRVICELSKPRHLISGVAGSGKTLIAIEATKIATKKKWKTLLICRSSNLNKYLSRVCSNTIDISTMYELCNGIMKDAKESGYTIESDQTNRDEDYLRAVLPAQVEEYLRNNTTKKKYDFIIIDEAQDIMSYTELTIFDKILKNGFENGKWLVCYDEEQALFGELKEGLDYIRSFSPNTAYLNVNKRTPESIYELACKLSGKTNKKSDLKDLGTIQTLSYKTTEEAKKHLFELVHNAVTLRGLKPEDIVILSPQNKKNTESIGTLINLQKEGIRGSYKIKLVNDGTFTPNQVGFFFIVRFKGLERKMVILTGIENFADPDLRNTIYVALTRATHYSALLYNKKADKSLQKLLNR